MPDTVAQVLHSQAQHQTLRTIKMPASLLEKVGLDTHVLRVGRGVVILSGDKTSLNVAQVHALETSGAAMLCNQALHDASAAAMKGELMQVAVRCLKSGR